MNKFETLEKVTGNRSTGRSVFSNETILPSCGKRCPRGRNCNGMCEQIPLHFGRHVCSKCGNKWSK